MTSWTTSGTQKSPHRSEDLMGASTSTTVTTRVFNSASQSLESLQSSTRSRPKCRSPTSSLSWERLQLLRLPPSQRNLPPNSETASSSGARPSHTVSGTSIGCLTQSTGAKVTMSKASEALGRSSTRTSTRVDSMRGPSPPRSQALTPWVRPISITLAMMVTGVQPRNKESSTTTTTRRSWREAGAQKSRSTATQARTSGRSLTKVEMTSTKSCPSTPTCACSSRRTMLKTAPEPSKKRNGLSKTREMNG